MKACLFLDIHEAQNLEIEDKVLSHANFHWSNTQAISVCLDEWNINLKIKVIFGLSTVTII